ncbi:MAG TPA: hypothetical protein VFE90_16360 [Myxococcales bacterium]|jgi:hypothetical protein|nr:hypothetical protein [Myxococcales bacterium]
MLKLPETPEPYRIRFSVDARQQAAALPPDARQRLGHRLIDLADRALKVREIVVEPTRTTSGTP